MQARTAEYPNATPEARAETMTLHPNDMLAERYAIGERLGGAAGVHTYAATDRQHDAPVVIKEMVLRDIENWKLYDLFEREARALAQLQHPRIPRPVAYFKQEDARHLRLYLVMARAPGRSLAAKLADGWKPTEQEVRVIAEQVLEILEYLHGLNPPVIHRDIKPSNLVMDDEGKVYLVDFGGVTEALRPEGGSTVVGTFGYMAPEQFAGHAVPASDLYGLGATLVHLLAGVSPNKIAQKALKMDFQSRVQCTEPLKNWLSRLLEPEIGKRFNSARVARQALSPAVSQAAVLKDKGAQAWETMLARDAHAQAVTATGGSQPRPGLAHAHKPGLAAIISPSVRDAVAVAIILLATVASGGGMACSSTASVAG